MKVTRLGQAGLWLEAGGVKILVDPYFSDGAFEVSGVHRRKPFPNRVWDFKPDLLLITHDHIDHYDPETAIRFVNENTAVTVLSPKSVWEKIRLCGGKNNFVLVSPGVSWTQANAEVTAVTAYHSDPYAVGFVVRAEGKTVYITGDTLYGEGLYSGAVDCVFLPVNGAGNNMNAADAARLADRCGAKLAVPVHYGVLDGLTHEVFSHKNKFVMEDFTEYEI